MAIAAPSLHGWHSYKIHRPWTRSAYSDGFNPPGVVKTIQNRFKPMTVVTLA